jgi:hypothetical protein
MGVQTKNLTYNFLKKTIIFLPVAVRQFRLFSNSYKFRENQSDVALSIPT